MGYITKGSITLSNINDAYTVSLTKQSCVIRADFDGSNPQLSDANTTISLYRGDKSLAFDCVVVQDESSKATATVTAYSNRTSYVLAIQSVPSDSLEGVVLVRITTDSGYTTDIQFGYSIIRESTMLDWIQDWEGGKTKIGGTYIMTPKLFIGKKSDYADYAEGGSNEQSSIMSVPGLTGVYIGPDSDSTGIYGYKDSVEIFHLNNTGGSIGGWDISNGGIYSTDGLLNILSDGTIKAIDSTTKNTVWEIRSNGYASFAKGSVKLYANGNAEFSGKITASDGAIAGWTIADSQLTKDNIFLSSSDNAICVLRDATAASSGTLLSNIQTNGGVAIYYTTNIDWGLVGYNAGTSESPASKIFSLGSFNMIAGWSFDEASLWSGIKSNTAGAYTTDGITIGSFGMRGQHWYIDSNGDISFLDGQIQFSTSDNSGNIVGWTLNEKRFSTSNMAIVSDDNNVGIYMSATNEANFNNTAASLLANYINENSGIYLKVDSNDTLLSAYNNGNNIFRLSANDISTIANWNIDSDALYTGTKSTDKDSFASESGSITLSNTGIRGNRWRLEADGSGALAGGGIKWDKDALAIQGNVTANSFMVSYDSDEDANQKRLDALISNDDISMCISTWGAVYDTIGANDSVDLDGTDATDRAVPVFVVKQRKDSESHFFILNLLRFTEGIGSSNIMYVGVKNSGSGYRCLLSTTTLYFSLGKKSDAGTAANPYYSDTKLKTLANITNAFTEETYLGRKISKVDQYYFIEGPVYQLSCYDVTSGINGAGYLRYSVTSSTWASSSLKGYTNGQHTTVNKDSVTKSSEIYNCFDDNLPSYRFKNNYYSNIKDSDAALAILNDFMTMQAVPYNYSLGNVVKYFDRSCGDVISRGATMFNSAIITATTLNEDDDDHIIKTIEVGKDSVVVSDFDSYNTGIVTAVFYDTDESESFTVTITRDYSYE